mmetsp:Transcript_58460/g.153513  ORF Transcript_58460/g.153513 Transcript_58460/m.153513 type:complete len:249 (+) Transcript_58460:847-1593(+)
MGREHAADRRARHDALGRPGPRAAAAYRTDPGGLRADLSQGARQGPRGPRGADGVRARCRGGAQARRRARARRHALQPAAGQQVLRVGAQGRAAPDGSRPARHRVWHRAVRAARRRRRREVQAGGGRRAGGGGEGGAREHARRAARRGGGEAGRVHTGGGQLRGDGGGPRRLRRRRGAGLLPGAVARRRGRREADQDGDQGDDPLLPARRAAPHRGPRLLPLGPAGDAHGDLCAGLLRRFRTRLLCAR